MIRRVLCMTAVALSAIALSAVQPASAATILQSGDTVDGWNITFPADVGLSLVADNTTGMVLNLEKFADFTSDEGIPIAFTQASYTNVASQIDIQSEVLKNFTGSAWSGFQFLLISPLNEGQNFASTFTQYSPFTTSTTTGGNTVTLGGGTLADGATALLGPAGGGLIINANPVSSGLPSDFNLKEIPIPGTGTPTGVPLPASVWTSLFGLAGVVLFTAFGKRRKLN